MNEISYIGKHTFKVNIPVHYHDNWEFIYCTSGEGVYVFDDNELPYKKGDVAIIPPGFVHSNQSVEGFTNIYFNMDNASLSFKTPTIISDDANGHILEAFNSLYYHFYSNVERKSLVISALGMLILSYVVVHQEPSNISAIVQKIESNILDNFVDCYYNLNDYIKEFHFNNDYIRKLFKRELGVTPNQYLIDKRLQTSADLLDSLKYDSNNISNVALTCGFRDPLYFSRMFKKKYGLSPTEYAKKNEKKKMDVQENQNVLLRPVDKASRNNKKK